jgi:hypothetical protein
VSSGQIRREEVAGWSSKEAVGWRREEAAASEEGRGSSFG